MEAGNSVARRPHNRRRIWRASLALVSALALGGAALAVWYGLGRPDARQSDTSAVESGTGGHSAHAASAVPGPRTTHEANNRRAAPSFDQAGPARARPHQSAAPGKSAAPVESPAPGKAAGPGKSAAPSASPAPTRSVPAKGSGTFDSAPGQSPRTGSGPLVRYQVEVERDLPFAPSEVAKVVDSTLADPRSWAAAGKATLQRVDGGEVELHILLATPDTVDRLCAPLNTNGWLSCAQGDRVMINAKRWAVGVDAYGKDVADYRHYVVNHEVGHHLGKGHLGCSGDGDLAPVMMQQTKGVGDCRPNPWPLPSELKSSD